MNKNYLFLIVNIGLWLYTIHSLFVKLTAPVNAMDTQIKGFFARINTFFGNEWLQVKSLQINWENVLFVIVAIALIIVLIKFWQITFIALAALTGIVVFWVVFQVIQNHFLLEDYFGLAVLVISLGNIWLSAKASNL